ncbi:MAG: MBL fold metallo-hydrolase, partial [Paracoccaceae bacterium]
MMTEHGSLLRSICAPNPSPMTAEGTLTYMLGETSIAVIDPGPASDQHLAAILAAVPQGGRITHIFVTHAHLDHSALAHPLAAATQAPILAAGPWDMGRST